MSLARVQNFSISLDGFGTGEGQSHNAPFGHARESSTNGCLPPGGGAGSASHVAAAASTTSSPSSTIRGSAAASNEEAQNRRTWSERVTWSFGWPIS